MFPISNGMRSFRLDKKNSEIKAGVAPILLLIICVTFVGIAASSYVRTTALTAGYDATSSQYDLLLYQVSRNRVTNQ